MTDDKNKTAPEDFKDEAQKANSLTNDQTQKDRIESGERNPEAVAEKAQSNIPQPKPDVTLSRTNETEEEAKERGARAKAKGGVNNEPGMDKPVPASTPQKNELLKARTDGNYDHLEEDKNQPQLNENGTPKPMIAKSDDEVTVRVTKKGEGQVHTGGAPGDTYARNDTFSVDRKIAEDLEERGFVEID